MMGVFPEKVREEVNAMGDSWGEFAFGFTPID
jgi:hypothetical protein